MDVDCALVFDERWTRHYSSWLRCTRDVLHRLLKLFMYLQSHVVLRFVREVFLLPGKILRHYDLADNSTARRGTTRAACVDNLPERLLAWYRIHNLPHPPRLLYSTGVNRLCFG